MDTDVEKRELVSKTSGLDYKCTLICKKDLFNVVDLYMFAASGVVYMIYSTWTG